MMAWEEDLTDIAGFDGGGGARTPGMWKKQGNAFSSGAFRKECSPADTLILPSKAPAGL